MKMNRNNSGSNGYGKTFQMMDDRKHGKGDLDDCITSKKMLIDTGLIDPDRIGIIGGIYGGYMVLEALAFRPESFKLSVDIFGVANWGGVGHYKIFRLGGNRQGYP